MRYTALAVDFDGTIARDGVVPPHVLEGLKRLRDTGRKLLLVTGRELEELLSIFPGITLFDRVVAENGALLYRPQSGEREELGDPPPEALVERLRARGVPISVGHSIVATVEPHETVVLAAIKELGLERQVIFNKGAVMILPAGVNKASGLAAALKELALSPRNLVAAGDGENDHALLESAEYSVATANAIPTLREKADRVTKETHGDGVLEVVADLIESDLARTPPRRERRCLMLGRDAQGEALVVPAASVSLLVAGRNATGKAAVVAEIVGRICTLGYQFCVLDTRGRYLELTPAVVLGGEDHPPETTEVLTALEKPEINVVVAMGAMLPATRAKFIADLLRRLAALREKTGRPHWIIADDVGEAYAGPRREPPARVPAGSMIHVSADARHLPAALLAAATAVLATGGGAGEELEALAHAMGVSSPPEPVRDPDPDEALAWIRHSGAAPALIALPAADRARDRERADVGRLLRRA
jgi:hydroxymethylpyrimidine pyrophosphatase-like HAD family hydrolase